MALPFPEFTGGMPLLPARMVNDYQCCPRLTFSAAKGRGLIEAR